MKKIINQIQYPTATRHCFSAQAAAAALQEPVWVIHYPVLGQHEVVEGSEINAAFRWSWAAGSTEKAVLYRVFPSGDVYEITRN